MNRRCTEVGGPRGSAIPQRGRKGRPKNRYDQWNEYEIESLPVHLLECRRMRLLRDLLYDPDWLQAKLERTDAPRLVPR